jgi:hypothetical protein
MALLRRHRIGEDRRRKHAQQPPRHGGGRKKKLMPFMGWSGAKGKKG